MLATISALLTVSSGFGNAPTDEPLFKGLGNHHRAVSNASPLAQKYFDQGMAFIFGYNHGESIRSFQQAAKIDPGCAMVWWGLANACGPHINDPSVSPERAKMAVDALGHAKALEDKASTAEKGLIEAAMKRFASPQPADRSGLDLAYADAMREVWKANPKDADVGALFAESMLDLRPWDQWKPDGTPQPGTEEVVGTLRRVMTLDPTHPQALHLWIHTVEASKHPEWAEGAADKLRNLEPALGHMVHMPSHIYVRVGRWRDAVIANDKGIAADNAFRKIRPNSGFYAVYMAHNRHMLTFAAMMRGQSHKAVATIDEMVKRFPPEWLKENAGLIDGFMAMPTEVRKRFGLWDDVLAMPEPAEYFPISRTMRHGARAIAYAAKGDVAKARNEQTAFHEARKAVPADAGFGNNTAAAILDVDEHLMNGEIMFLEGKQDEGLAELREGVKAEDALHYDEPPGWIQPIRHTLGAALLSIKRFDEAEKVYREDLTILPNNGWSLYGLSHSLAGLGRKKEAAKVQKEFDKVWANADLEISSSCLCLPGQ